MLTSSWITFGLRRLFLKNSGFSSQLEFAAIAILPVSSAAGRLPTRQLVLHLAVGLGKQLLEVGALQVAEQLPKKSVPSVCWSSGCPSA